MSTDRETPWKELLDHAPHLALAFFYPDIHADLDWTHDPESLEQEFRKSLPEAILGKKIVGKLLKLVNKAGDVRYLHFEIQSYYDEHFGWRVYVYNSKAEDRYGQPIVSLPLLIDDDPDWMPAQYESELYGTRRVLTFRPRKVIGWRGREEELLADANPVATFVLAFLKGKEFEGEIAERAKWTVRLMRRLKELGMGAAEMGRWVGLFGWLLPLSSDYNEQIARAMDPEEKEGIVPIMNYWEKAGFDRGVEVGEEKGIEKGIEKGEQRGLHKAIALGLRLKFGADGLALLPQVERIESLPVLGAICDALEPAATLDDIRRLLPATSNGHH